MEIIYTLLDNFKILVYENPIQTLIIVGFIVFLLVIMLDY